MESLDSAKNTYQKLLKKISSLTDDGSINQEQKEKYEDKFSKSIEDDLNTSMMITTLYEVLNDKELNDYTKKEILQTS